MTVSIGVRELRQNASKYLRLVEERREPIQITDRGRPVAVLSPIPTGSRIEHLAATGRLQRATQPWSALPPPLRPKRGEKPASETLAEMRAHER